MTEMPEFRAWADRAFKNSMKPIAGRKKRPTRYKCVSGDCDAGTTLNQARVNGYTCRRCQSDLISKEKLSGGR